MATTKGPLKGAPIAIDPAKGNVYWSWLVDSNIDPAFQLYHTESATGVEERIASGSKPSAVHIDFGLNGLTGDTLRWRILCLPLNAGKFPVWVQFFQGTHETGFDPITDVIEYEADLSTAASKVVKDTIVFARAE